MEEDYRRKSVFTVAALVLIMVGIGFLVNYFQSGVTGGAVIGGAACFSNNDCDDGLECTIDSCKNPGEKLSFCANRPVDFCKNDDGCCPAGCKAVNDNDCG